MNAKQTYVSYPSLPKPLPVGEVAMSACELAGEGIYPHCSGLIHLNPYTAPHPVKANALRPCPQGEAQCFGEQIC